MLQSLSNLASIGVPFIPGWSELQPFIAELWLIVAIIGVLLTPFFTRKSNTACAVVSLAGLTLAFVTLLASGSEGMVGSFMRGMLVSDPLAILWKLMLLLFVAGIIWLWFATTSTSMREGDGPEFFTLLLGATLGMSMMASVSNLLMLFLAVELASLPSYVLAGFRKTHRVGAEASLKYVLFGAATSSIMAYGLSVLYGLYGTLDIATLARAMVVAPGSGALLVVAMLGLIVGIGFKISAVPFHFWCPDVFEGAGIDVSAFLSVASKGAGLVLLMRVFTLIADAAGYQNAAGLSLTSLAIVVGVLGAVTATVGNTAAFLQNNIKRLLAYSSIAHAGYMLCALSLIVKHGSALATDATANTIAYSPAQVLLLYLAVYLFMNLGAFTVAGVIDKVIGSEEIGDYANLGWRAPVLSVCMAVFMFSLVGLPPLAGFSAKLNLMYVLGGNGGWWWALVAVIGINTVFSLFYYLRVIKVMYLSSGDDTVSVPTRRLASAPLGTVLAVVCAAMLVIMFFGFGPLGKLTERNGRLLVEQRPTAPTTVPTTAPTTPTAMATTDR